MNGIFRSANLTVDFLLYMKPNHIIVSVRLLVQEYDWRAAKGAIDPVKIAKGLSLKYLRNALTIQAGSLL
jgi:hypothetical protein